MKFLLALAAAAALIAAPVHAQVNAGTVITVSGIADVKADNDQAVATFYVEEQDKDKAAAASRVNQKMKAGTELIKKEDPQAQLTTRGYFTYPMYSDENPGPNQPRKRVQTGWRVGQYLEVKTQNLKQLPSVAADAQKTLALNGLSFGLSDAAAKKFEAARLEAGYKDFMERVGAIARTMGHKESDASIESLDFDGNDTPGRNFAAPALFAKAVPQNADVAESSFEPGVTTLNIRVVGKVRFH
jgi:predicted secreted protein